MQAVDKKAYVKELTAEDGFKFAFSFSKGDGTIPPEVGSIPMYAWAWYMDSDGIYKNYFSTIKTHECT